jgi:hypothetical protein
LNELVASGSPAGLPIRRNTVILSATMAVNSAVLQLTAAVSSLTFVLVTGVRGLLGLGPAIVLLSIAAFVGALFLLLLPETSGKPLPE